MAARTKYTRSQDGVTLIEILVVLAILVLLMLAAVSGIRKVRQSDLRDDGSRLAGALRFAYDRATATGEHHRVMIDLDEEAYQVERCEGKVRLRHGLEAHQEEEEARIREQQMQLMPDATTGEFNGLPAAPTGMVGSSTTCGPVKGEHGKPQLFKRNLGIVISQVYVGHLDGPADEGKVAINFFPLGSAERAVVEISSNEGDIYSIIVHPLTGKVRMVGGAYKRPEEFVSTDAEGNEVSDE